MTLLMPELEKLQRKFDYCRKDSGSLTVTDEVVFSQPSDFGTALITFDEWKQPSDSSILIRNQDKALRVDITSNAEFKIQSETIEEDLSGGRLPTRLGISLTQPVSHAVVTVTIKPDKN
jgi:hypothetical protein